MIQTETRHIILALNGIAELIMMDTVTTEKGKTMKWNDFNREIGVSCSEEETTVECPNCGENIFMRKDVVLASYPPQFSYFCKSCGWSGTSCVKWKQSMKWNQPVVPTSIIDAALREEKNMSEYERGEFDVLDLLSSAWHGKQYYFMQDNGIVYSRDSCKYMRLDDAISEFASKIGYDGSI